MCVRVCGCVSMCVYLYLHSTILHLSLHLAVPTVASVLQALVEQPPVHPNDVLREIVELAQLPMSEAPYEDDFAQLENQAAVDEDPDLVDLDGTSEAETYGGQSFQQGGRPEMGGSGGAAWSDDSFTDAALEDDAFDTSGFDVVDQ